MAYAKRVMEASGGAYNVAQALGEISYADGIRLMNQSYLDADPKNMLVPRAGTVTVDLKGLFG